MDDGVLVMAEVVEVSQFELFGLKLNEIATISIAFLALVVTLYQVMRQRRHDRISVRPNLELLEWHEHSKDNVVTFTLDLENNGLGTAIIKSHRVMRGHPNTAEWLEVNLEKELKSWLPNECSLQTLQIRPNSTMPANKSHRYLEIKLKAEDEQTVSRLVWVIYEYNIEIEYESMHGEKLSFDTYYITKNFRPELTQLDYRDVPTEAAKTT